MHDNAVPRLSESSALLPASIRRAALFPAATLVLALVGLAACGGISRKPGEPPPPLPEGYRRSAAFHMLLDYEKDGTGPAEIESTPWRASSLLGGERTYLLARYPVRRRDWLGRDAEGMRCFSIVTSWRPGEPEIRYEIGHQRRDPPSCMETVALEPFTELNGDAPPVGGLQSTGAAALHPPQHLSRKRGGTSPQDRAVEHPGLAAQQPVSLTGPSGPAALLPQRPKPVRKRSSSPPITSTA
ncbi:hypothetical protein [Roseomonas gilardii]|uniref:hypothetical protein n=1 Tax=Roseomonas gilardii TaxID=257708 RepID=UPI0012EC7D99|nr:hypothetical protein [Roseomonas gilardii]